MGTATRHSAFEADWRKRHPARAREERGFRLDAADRRRDHAQRDRLQDAGTPETRQKARRTQQGAIARLVRAGHLTADQLGWACEIRAVSERIGADVGIGTVSLETRVDCGRKGDGSFFERLGAVRAEVAFAAWRDWLGQRALPVLAVTVFDEACRPAARRYGMRDTRLRELLSAALDAWPGFYRDARDQVSEADLLAAHAGLS